MKSNILWMALSLFCLNAYSQSPTRLTTDLIEHTDKVYKQGYPTTLKLEKLRKSDVCYEVATIHSEQPYFGWEVDGSRPNTLQTHYRILVASSKELLKEGAADLWDSGRTESDNSVAVRYQGSPLKPSTFYYWTVKTWNNHGEESQYAPAKCFLTNQHLDGRTAQYPLEKCDEHPLTRFATSDTTFFDFGKDAFGTLRLTLTSDAAHDTITIRLGEKAENHRVARRPGSSIRYSCYRMPLMRGTHTYTLTIKPDYRNTKKARGAIIMPAYIGEVTPFRYCEIDGYSRDLGSNDVVRQAVNYPFDDSASEFHSSDSILNKVWDLCKYSIKATSFTGIFVDGDRERIPYEADALINQLGYYAVDREYTIARRSHEHLITHPTWPTEWILQSVLMAWNDYLYTGNPASLRRYYNDLKAKALIELKEDNGLISTLTGKVTADVKKSIHLSVKKNIADIVDWPRNGVLGVSKQSAGEADSYKLTTFNTVVNAYHYQALNQLSLIAKAIGEDKDAKEFAQQAEQVRKQVNRLLLDKQTGTYRDGTETEHRSLHANMFPMAFGMVPDKYVKTVSEFIRSRGMACSVYGAQFLLDAAYAMGDGQYALSLLTSTSDRSWYNMLRRGSTITTEAWDCRYKPNQDWNHAWGSAPANVIPRGLFGIEPTEPGFRSFRIKPQPGSLRQASIMVPSVRGTIEVSFVNEKEQGFNMDVTIPANSTAEVWIPKSTKNGRLFIDGKKCKGKNSDGFVIVKLGSGKHSIVLK
ncbi:MAG: family 78 glycoside hydrolase catalytic domain [Prevotella sp.]|jgi:alpha-L-rhamnosidase